MRALTIRQPWADAIAHGEKRVENRTRRTNYRGPLLIHAGAAADRRAVLCRDRTWTDTRGAILATARLVGCHQANATGPLCCRPWGFSDAWHWELADVRPLPEPVPARGALGLWTPPADVLRAVLEQEREAVQ